MSPIPFSDLSRTSAELESAVRTAIADIVSTGWFVMEPQHDALEQELADYTGADQVVLLGNGTDALELALAAVGVGSGDSVLTIATAGGYTSVATHLLGAAPVYADVDSETLLMTAETCGAALSNLDTVPKAIVVTHLYGALAEIESIVGVARHRGIAVVEDCAQSLGATIGGARAERSATWPRMSFYPTKNLGALGDGGVVFTNRTEVVDAVRRMRQYGWAAKCDIAHAHGRNSRMDEMQAAIVRLKLPFMDAWNERCRELHRVYELAEGDRFALVNRSSELFIAHLAV